MMIDPDYAIVGGDVQGDVYEGMWWVYGTWAGLFPSVVSCPYPIQSRRMCDASPYPYVGPY